VGPADVQVDTFDMPLFHSGYCFSQCEVEWCWKMRHGQAVPVVACWIRENPQQVGVVTPYVAQVRLKPKGGVDPKK